MKRSLVADCSRESNKVIFIDDISYNELEVSDRIRAELMKVDKYIEYSRHTYDNKFKAYTIYTIEDRFIDENDNLILVGNQKYITE